MPPHQHLLPPECRITIPYWLLPLHRVGLPALSPSEGRLILHPESLPHHVTATVLGGKSLVDQGTIGLIFEPGQKPRPGKRESAVSVQNLALKLPPHLHEAFFKSASVMAPTGRVPGKVAKFFVRYCENQTYEPEKLAESGLAFAYQADGKSLGVGNRRGCGRKTLEWRSVASDGSTDRSLSRLRCKSHRCPRCASWEVSAWRHRVNAQLGRDAGAGRARPVMFALTLPPDVGANNAEAVKLIFRFWENFARRLRRQYGKDLAYVLVLEAHASGRPHAQGLIRCERLAEALADRASDSAERAAEDFQAHAIASGFGRAYVAIAESVTAAVADTFKTDQIVRDLPRGTHRIRASGRAGSGTPGSFFLDATPSGGHPYAGMAAPKGLPAFPDLEPYGRGGDAPLSQAEHRVRVLRVGKGRCGPLMDLEVVSKRDHCGARFQTEFPSNSTTFIWDIAAAITACGGAPEGLGGAHGVVEDPLRALTAVVGLEARVLFQRGGRTNPWTGERVRQEGVWRWLEPGEVAPPKLEGVPVEQTAPDRPLDRAVLGGKRPAWLPKHQSSRGRTSDVLIHHAPLEAVVEATHGLDPSCLVENPSAADFDSVRTPDGVAFLQCMTLRELPRDRSDELSVYQNCLAFYKMLAIAEPAWVCEAELSRATVAVEERLAILSRWTSNYGTGTG